MDAANNRGDIAQIFAAAGGGFHSAGDAPAGGDAAAPAHADVSHATYRLRLLDSVGTVLVERTLTLTELDDHTTESDAALFSDLFAEPTGASPPCNCWPTARSSTASPPASTRPR